MRPSLEYQTPALGGGVANLKKNKEYYRRELGKYNLGILMFKMSKGLAPSGHVEKKGEHFRESTIDVLKASQCPNDAKCTGPLSYSGPSLIAPFQSLVSP